MLKASIFWVEAVLPWYTCKSCKGSNGSSQLRRTAFSPPFSCFPWKTSMLILVFKNRNDTIKNNTEERNALFAVLLWYCIGTMLWACDWVQDGSCIQNRKHSTVLLWEVPFLIKVPLFQSRLRIRERPEFSLLSLFTHKAWKVKKLPYPLSPIVQHAAKQLVRRGGNLHPYLLILTLVLPLWEKK